MQATTISTTIDFNQEGKQHGFLKLPHSSDNSAWGCIMIPICVIKHGRGATALLTAGNHGDEYEGITALHKLANHLHANQIAGRVIIIPAMNYPAVMNASRTSPIDNGNLNRAFPGNPIGTVTERIADYFQRYLIPMCDYALDIHSGGKSLEFIPLAAVHRLKDQSLEASCISAAKSFGAPNTLLMLDLEAHALYDTAVESQGKIFVSTELFGGGTSTPVSIAFADAGVRNFLNFAGIMNTTETGPKPSRMLEMPDLSCYVHSEHKGLLEMCVNLSDQVHQGDLLARVYTLERTGASPALYYAKRSGIVAARHFPALINMGDTMAVIAAIVDEQLPNQ